MSLQQSAWAHCERDGPLIEGRIRTVRPAERNESAPFVHSHSLRVWALTTGFTFEGRFVGYLGSRVLIRRQDGVLLEVPARGLSHGDSRYLATVGK
jgi:hypothetical protein